MWSAPHQGSLGFQCDAVTADQARIAHARAQASAARLAAVIEQMEAEQRPRLEARPVDWPDRTASGVPAPPRAVAWNCSVHGKPGASANGNGVDLDDCKAKFKTAWTMIRADLSEDDIASAHQYAENSREALARYDRKQR